MSFCESFCGSFGGCFEGSAFLDQFVTWSVCEGFDCVVTGECEDWMIFLMLLVGWIGQVFPRG